VGSWGSTGRTSFSLSFAHPYARAGFVVAHMSPLALTREEAEKHHDQEDSRNSLVDGATALLDWRRFHEDVHEWEDFA
jgi:hypothetical protein